MTKRAAKQQAIVGKLASFLLENGLQKASLRNLAAAADTSDRMLMHYFKNKDALIHQTLVYIAELMQQMLDQARPGKMSMGDLLTFLGQQISNPMFQPFFRVWLEIVAESANGHEQFQSLSKHILDIYRDWIDAILVTAEADQHQNRVSLVLTLIEGFVLLHNVGGQAYIDQAIQSLHQAHF